MDMNSTKMSWMELMISEAKGTTEIVSSIFASIVALSLFVIYPLPIFWKLLNEKQLEDFHLYPLLAFFLYNMIWMTYVFSLGCYPLHYWCFYFSSGIGVIVETGYILVLVLNTERSKAIKSMHQILIIVGTFCSLVSMVLYFLIERGYEISAYLGLIGLVFGICMYASPLSIIVNIHNGNVVGYLIYWLCYACFLNCVAWSVVGLVSTFDIYVT
ncbi:hypothetical protein OROHE_019373 [Orobanche hederae]